MSKKWPPKQFKELEPTVNEFKEQQEKKLDSDHAGWRPKMPDDYESLPINGEYAKPDFKRRT